MVGVQVYTFAIFFRFHSRLFLYVRRLHGEPQGAGASVSDSVDRKDNDVHVNCTTVLVSSWYSN